MKKPGLVFDAVATLPALPIVSASPPYNSNLVLTTAVLGYFNLVLKYIILC